MTTAPFSDRLGEYQRRSRPTSASRNKTASGANAPAPRGSNPNWPSTHREVLARLDVALELTDRLQAAYQLASPAIRGLLNQAIFKRIWIDNEAVNGVELAEPFADLITISYFREVVRRSPRRNAAAPSPDTPAALGKNRPQKRRNLHDRFRSWRFERPSYGAAGWTRFKPSSAGRGPCRPTARPRRTRSPAGNPAQAVRSVDVGGGVSSRPYGR